MQIKMNGMTTGKRTLFLLVALLVGFVFTGCGRENGGKVRSDPEAIAAELGEAFGNMTVESSAAEAVTQENQEGSANEDVVESQESLVKPQKQQWPEKGYESIPKLEMGNTIWFTDSGVSFNVSNENISPGDLEKYQQLLLDKGYVLKNNSENQYNYMLGEAENVKSLVSLTYDGSSILNVSGSLH